MSTALVNKTSCLINTTPLETREQFLQHIHRENLRKYIHARVIKYVIVTKYCTVIQLAVIKKSILKENTYRNVNIYLQFDHRLNNVRGRTQRQWVAIALCWNLGFSIISAPLTVFYHVIYSYLKINYCKNIVKL